MWGRQWERCPVAARHPLADMVDMLAQVAAAKAGAVGGVLTYDPAGQQLDGGNFSAFIMSALLDAQARLARPVS